MRTDAEILQAMRENAQKDMAKIHSCIVCGKDLKPLRDHVDTCSGPCYQRLLKIQRTLQ